jgi:ElaB/YqjD/DUF883 family membrane-anchored ribosome-binding protein
MVDDNGRIDEEARKTRESAEQAYQAAKEYAKESGVYATQVAGVIATFIQEEPWLAMAGAFVLGYVAAQLIKRVQ